MTTDHDRRHKTPWTRFIEILVVASALGIGTLLLQVGGYKEKIDNMCKQFEKSTAQNNEDHRAIYARIGKTQQAIVAITGKAIE